MATPDPTFAGRSVWITGASSGIGEALAHAFARRGARLVLSSRRPAELERVRDACPPPAGDGGHLVVPLDLADPARLTAAASEVLAAAGPPDVMVHNGGISQRALAKDTRPAVDRRILEVDYLGAVTLTKELLPAMLERGSGRFVVVTSLVGRIGTPLRSAYAAAKHALHGFFESLRAEVYDAGVRVTIVCPGFVRTEVSRNALTADGSPQGTMDRAQAEGMPADECAECIVAAVEAGRDEVLIGGRERFAVYLFRFFPGLYRRLIRRARVT